MAMVMIILTLCVTVPVGCAKKEAATSGVYAYYTYDTTSNTFAEIGCNLSFNEDKTGFELDYLGVVHLYGEMKQLPTGYLLNIQQDAFDQASYALEQLSEEQKERQTPAVKSTWDASIASSEQIFLYGDYAFSSVSIDLIRRVGTGTKSNYTSVEGYYESANNSENIYLFRNGLVYGNVKDSDGNATYKDGEPVMEEVAGASYVLNEGFIIMTKLDGDGGVLLDTNDKPQKIVYLLGSITYPTDIADFVYTEDEYSETTKALAENLAGKTVGLLTRSFYSTKDLSQYDFN